MANTERLVVLVSLVLVGLAFSLAIEPPLLWLLVAVLIAMVCVGTDHLTHMHWRVHIRRRRYAVTLWILPALLVLAAALFLRLPLFANGLAVGAGLVFTGVLLALVIVGEYRSLDVEDPLHDTARFMLNIISYVTVFALYTAIYSTKGRSLVTATAITLVSALLALELLRGVESRISRAWLYAAVGGLMMGEITWALNYWTVPGLVGGVFLLLAYYAITGVVQNHLSGLLERRLAVEYGLVTALGLVFIAAAVWIQRPPL